ncbi:hypothetical protein JYT28_00100 [Desulfobulbus sp. AH-315-M07]|nr:hypothetical protein [Desulfobulbus sp. AH-315-M07]
MKRLNYLSSALRIASPLAVCFVLTHCCPGARQPAAAPVPTTIATSVAVTPPPVETVVPVVAPAPAATLLAANDHQGWYERARPVFEKHCVRCHVRGNSGWSEEVLAHLDMSSYPFGGHHASEVGGTIRKALGDRGAKATMPKDKPGIVQGDELTVVLSWANAFEAAHPSTKDAGGHDHSGHDHSGHNH